MSNKPEQPHDHFETQRQCEEVYTEPEGEHIIETNGGPVNMDQPTGDKGKLVLVYKSTWDELDDVEENDFEPEWYMIFPPDLEDIGTPIDKDGQDMEYVGMGFVV